jgi:5-methylcytosine-specific restriction endonuclease McrA
MIKIEKKGIKINFTEYYKNEKNKNKKIKDLLRKKSQPIKPKKNKRWSQYYDFCRICGLSSVKHKSLGYCEKCYSKSEEFKNMQKASRLRNKDHWYKNQKEYRKEYYKRPEVIKKMKKKHDQIKFGGNREKRLKKDNYCCSVCGMSLSESLKKYKRELYVVHLNDKNNHSLDNLKTFCKDCHNRRVIKIMRKKLNQNNN